MLNLFRRKPRPPEPVVEPFSLDAPLLHLSPSDAWRIRDACEGVQIFGGTGSGKTSGSGRALAKTYLAAGFGGLVLTAKPDERRLWEEYARETGRLEHLRMISPAQPWRFNFMDYEVQRPGAGAGLTENIVGLFSHVLELAERKRGGGSNEEYWQRTLKQLLRNTIDLVILATGQLSLSDIYQVIISAPQDLEQVEAGGWQASSKCFRYISEVYARKEELSESRSHDFELTAHFWLQEFPGLAEKTRSIIVSTFTSMADSFLRGPIRDMFCTSTNITPDLSMHGAIIVLDLPVKEFSEVGQFAQALFKYIWQKTMERRDIGENPRPVFLWADESQFFVNSYDALFQSTARSSRTCTVYLTQNLPSYLSAMGSGDRGKAEADALLGNLQTKIFHANGDTTTNQYAADVIAQTWQMRASFSAGHGEQARGPGKQQNQGSGKNTSAGASEQLAYQVLPGEFTTLRKGGPDNNLTVDAVIFQGGRVWNATGKNYLMTAFNQLF
jgi:hypothetical protein